VVALHEIYAFRGSQEIPRQPLKTLVESLHEYERKYGFDLSKEFSMAAAGPLHELSAFLQNVENDDPGVSPEEESAHQQNTENMEQELEDAVEGQEEGGMMEATEVDERPRSASSEEAGAEERASPETSEQEALLLEQRELQEALLRSKADARNADGVTICRLTSKSPQITAHLLSSQELQEHFENVRSAGCDVCPEWANGAILLVPLTHSQVLEAEIDLQSHNIVLLSVDVAKVESALKQMPKRKRNNAAIKPEHHVDKAAQPRTTAGTKSCVHMDSQHGTSSNSAVDETMPQAPSISHFDDDYDGDGDGDDDVEVRIEIQNTFLNFPVRSFQISECSHTVQSAPAHAGDDPDKHSQRNPRRWAIGNK